MKASCDAVEAAVNARGELNNPKWHDAIFGYATFHANQKEHLRDEARAALEAAAPYIAAHTLEAVAEDVRFSGMRRERAWLRRRAAEIRASAAAAEAFGNADEAERAAAKLALPPCGCNSQGCSVCTDD